MRAKNLNKGSLYFFLMIIVLCFNQIGCENHDVSRDVFGHVEGTVIDSLTRLPIDSAWISGGIPDTLFETVIFTDSTGHYYLTDFPGKRIFYCGKKWYVTKKSEEFIIRKNETTRVDFELVPTKE